MNIRSSIVSGAAALTLLTTGAGAAQAQSHSNTTGSIQWAAPASGTIANQVAPAKAAASGNFYGWRAAYWGGGGCAWPDDDSNFGNDCGGMRNVISSAWNDSSQGNVVRLYVHPGYSGAYACLGPGDSWYDFTEQNIRFTFRPGLDRYNAPANDEVASFTFNRGC
jgi:hypothetical protein